MADESKPNGALTEAEINAMAEAELNRMEEADKKAAAQSPKSKEGTPPPAQAEAQAPEPEPESAPINDDREAESPAPAPAPRGARLELTPVTILAGGAILAILGAAAGAWVASAPRKAQQASLQQLHDSLGKIEEKLNTPPPAPPPPVRPEDYPGLISSAHLEFREGQYAKAADLYAAAIRAEPEGPFTGEAHYQLGMCLLKRGDPHEAVIHFRTVVARFPGCTCFGRASIEAARLLTEFKDFAQGRRLLYGVIACRDRLIGDESECPGQAYFALARCYDSEADVIAAAMPSARVAAAPKVTHERK